MIKVAILGAGFMGSTHARAYQKLEGVEVSAIVDPVDAKASSLAAELNTRSFSSAEEVFEDSSIDVVDVALPTPFHSKYAIEALDCGKHVLLEKPFALTLEEVDRIIAAVEKSPKFLMVAQVLRFWPEYIVIRKLIHEKRLGKTKMAIGCRLSSPPGWAAWILDCKASGGMVLDFQIHNLDVFNWIFGRPRKIFAHGIQDSYGNWVHCMADIEYEDAVIFDEASQMMPDGFPFTTGLRAICEKGVLEYRTRSGGPGIDQSNARHELLVHEPCWPAQKLDFETGDAYEREIAYFIDCVRSGEPPQAVTLQDARLAVQTSLAVIQSLNSGRTVDLQSSEE
jgi:predicted dehydrogenase